MMKQSLAVQWRSRPAGQPKESDLSLNPDGFCQHFILFKAPLFSAALAESHMPLHRARRTAPGAAKVLPCGADSNMPGRLI